ncbi:hypothetical protein [Baekduia sp. Peel2402]|uniref:hypothetical protein n=1 Tax=Baekduia sp. Peel2402 TaxID=3458296 RepID=UPI00403E90E8
MSAHDDDEPIIEFGPDDHLQESASDVLPYLTAGGAALGGAGAFMGGVAALRTSLQSRPEAPAEKRPEVILPDRFDAED